MGVSPCWRSPGPRYFLALGVGLALTASLARGAIARRGTPDPTTARSDQRPNLLLVVIDSARRDHMGLYGHARPTSPVLDALARQGRVYDAAFAGSSWTVPSVAFMLNPAPQLAGRGLMPVQTALARSGYRTGCFTDNALVGQNPQIVTGFGRVERSSGGWPGETPSALDEEAPSLDAADADRRVVDKAEAWALQNRGPVFLYLHLMGAHYPFRSAPIDGRTRPGRRIEFPPATGSALTPDEAEDIVARYDGGLRKADANVGRILGAAAAWGRPFVAIVTADHGESLGDAGRWRHGGSLAPELLAVPLVVVGEGVSAARVPAPVGQASLSSTLLAAAGIACAECPGGDLRAGDGPGYAQGWLPPNLYYRIEPGYKLVFDQRDQGSRLFDRADSTEAHDLARRHPEVVASMVRGLMETTLLDDPFWYDRDARLDEQLRTLGYVGATPAAPGRADPVSRR